jgi:LmbE family N-acetylglucosaminyl deacetylase
MHELGIPSRRFFALVRAPLLALALLAVPVLSDLSAQAATPQGGVVEAGLLLRQLQGVKRVLMIAAHPDDEDTSLLTVVARGMGAEAAYLSLTRGDGGQNLIGPELGEGLGVIRTGELEAARRLDGGAQFFGRAFDYGYSKSADEAFEHWPREELLRDVVWVIRNFRPQVIIGVWTGTSRDGHGQHQAAGMVTNDAFDAAADPNMFSDLPGLGGQAWRVEKLYHSARRNPPDDAERVAVGTFDPLLGRSYRQVAGDSRSQHRSQDMGAPQPLGPSDSRMVPVRSYVGTAPGLFSGIDTILAGLGHALSGEGGEVVRRGMGRFANEIRKAVDDLSVIHPESAVEDLAAALTAIRESLEIARAQLGSTAIAVHDLERKLELTQRALMASASIVFDVRTADDIFVPGEDVQVDLRLWNSGGYRISDATVHVRTPDGAVVSAATATTTTAPQPVAGRGMAQWSFAVSVPASAKPDEMYFLAEPRDGDLYRWPADNPSLWGLPRDPGQLRGSVSFTLELSGGSELNGGTEHVPVTIEVPARYFGVDKALGQFEKVPLIAPALSVGLQPAGMAWPLADRAARRVTVVLRNEAEAGTRGEVRLALPAGWTATPEFHSFDLSEPTASRGFAFEVTPGETVGEGTHIVRAFAVSESGQRFDQRVDIIDYPHIERTLMFADAATRISMFPVRVAEGIRVGYIMGSGDDGLSALEQMGVDAELVGPERIASGDFSGYDVLVFGIRVYETRPDVAAVNDRILEFARSGGTVIVQYNKYEYPQGDYAPYPVSMGSRPVDRVTDHRSPVRFIDPDSPVLNSPNVITMADFDGWVQERGLYFLKEWDERYTPILELTDPDEAPKAGSVVVASVGDGIYAYAALSFFREFPAGVPGAFRLFANLVSLTAESWGSASGGEFE